MDMRDPSSCGTAAGGALSHLVEAATALANLTSTSSSSSSSSPSLGGGGGGGGGSFATFSPCQEDSTQNHVVTIIGDDEDENRQRRQEQSGGGVTGTLSSTLQPTHGASSSSSSSPPPPPAATNNSNNNNNIKEIFPTRLMAILNDSSLVDIITWLPHGRSFVIIRPDVFTEQVLPKYLPPADARASTKYPSFTRKLNRWGFRQATRGPDTGAFHHPLFQRTKPELCLEMVCQRSRDRRGGGGGSGNLPAKKRQIIHQHTALTKESLDTFNASTMSAGGAMAQQQQQQPTNGTAHLQQTGNINTPQQMLQHAMNQAIVTATVSVSGDSASSISTNSTTTTLSGGGIAPGITTDATLTQRALRQRNEEERMRVAKAMLYHAYLDAIQRKG